VILIVGASGKLGSAVARKLLAEREQVRAMSRVPDRLEGLRQLGAEVVAGDLTIRHRADSPARTPPRCSLQRTRFSGLAATQCAG